MTQTPAQQQPIPQQQPVTPVAPTTQTPPPQTGGTVPPPPSTPAPEVNNAHGGWHFPKATIILIIILGGLASFLLYLAINPQKQKPTEITVVPTPTPYAQSTLMFEKAEEDASPAGTITPTPKVPVKTEKYNVLLTTNANSVNAVQLELGFDPQVIQVNDIVPGSFMPNSVQLTKDINNKTGRISYAIGVGPNDKGLTGTGIVASISLEFLPTATSSSTKLSFLPKTLVAGAGVNPSVLKSSTDITIDLPQSTTTPPASVVSPTPLITQ